MGWSFTLGSIRGTAVKVHFTFLLLLAWYALKGYRFGGAEQAMWMVILLLALFACVLLHEFGHITMAARFGVRTPDVILLPIGGLARLERIPEQPRQEFLIALAGPAVTLAIIIVLGLVIDVRGPAVVDLVLTGNARNLREMLFAVNVWLLGFNLLPAFPMDGGRVLRALLARRMGLPRATRIAATIGQTAAAVAAVWAFLFSQNYMLGLVAVFVFLGAAAEAQAVEQRETLKGLTVEKLMVRQFRALPFYSTLAQATDMLLAGEQREFPVIDTGGRVVGLLGRDGLIRGLAERGSESSVGDAMATNLPIVGPLDGFERAIQALRESGLSALPVRDEEGRLLGLLTMDNINDMLLIRRARRTD